MPAQSTMAHVQLSDALAERWGIVCKHRPLALCLMPMPMTSHVSEDSLEQVRLHLVSHLVSQFGTDRPREFAHAASFATARRCLRFLVSIAFCQHWLNKYEDDDTGHVKNVQHTVHTWQSSACSHMAKT